MSQPTKHLHVKGIFTEYWLTFLLSSKNSIHSVSKPLCVGQCCLNLRYIHVSFQFPGHILDKPLLH